jgi:hypothetical protein
MELFSKITEARTDSRHRQREAVNSGDQSFMCL